MKETPLLFSEVMVKAILSGHKTMTRRVINPQPEYVANGKIYNLADLSPENQERNIKALLRDGRYQPGNRLWVRETFWVKHDNDIFGDRLIDCGVDLSEKTGVRYPATDSEPERDPFSGWYYYSKRPSIHMPRWASRITLEIVSVRVEQIQSISENDVWEEGLYRPDWWDDMDPWHDPGDVAKGVFKSVWDIINGKRGYSWDSNPWVWVIEFKRVEP